MLVTLRVKGLTVEHVTMECITVTKIRACCHGTSSAVHCTLKLFRFSLPFKNANLHPKKSLFLLLT